MPKPEDRLEHLQRLLELELAADRERFRAEIQALDLKERVRRGFTWSPVTVVKTGFVVGERAFVVLERPAGRRRDSSIKSGSPVRYYTTVAGVERPEVSGVVHWIKDTEMMVVLGGRHVPAWSDVRGQGIDLEFDENAYKEMRLALERARVAKGRHAELVEILTGRTPPAFAKAADALPQITGLNDSQRAAIALIESATDLAIVHGPPGTGKTTTLVAAIQRIVERERQVLVCAPSNVAVDLLAERLDAKGLHVVRTGHISRVSEDLLRLTLDQQVAEHPEHRQIRRIKLEAADIRKKALRHKRTFSAHDRSERGQQFKQAGELDGWARQLERRILDEVLDAAQVVCCTLTGAGADFLRDRTFRTVVVDEAAQALEPAVWIPLQRARRLVMAGDPFQLPPTVKSREAERAGLGVTLMEYLLPRCPEAAALLTVQYRMHAAIMGFSNAYFYGGQLVAAEGVGARGLPLEGEPAVRFIDTAGTGFEERRNPETKSRYNADEQLLVLTYLHEFRGRFAPVEMSAGADVEMLPGGNVEMSLRDVEPFDGPPARLNVGEAHNSTRAQPASQRADGGGTSQRPDVVGINSTRASPAWPSIALISPYREQVEQLRAEVAEDPLLASLDIVVHTVDGFQGQERDWVIVSLVRTNPGGDIGFLRDYRRMNVAMTRARRQLVVIGDSATIGNDPFYAAFLDYVEEHGSYESAFAYMQST